MTTKAQKLRVGLFAALSAGLVAVVLIVFGGLRFWEKEDHYRIVFPKSVMGLDEGALVYLAGIKVGTVDDIGVSPNDLRAVVVTISVKHGTPIHADTEAHLEFAGITGLKVIDLEGGSYAAPQVPEGGVILAGTSVIDKLKDQAEQIADESGHIMDRAQQVADNLAALTDPKRYEAIDQIIAEMKVTSVNLAQGTGLVRGMIAENRVALHGAIDAFHESADQVNGAAADTGELIAQIKTFVIANEGPLRSALFDLRQASRSFKELARDVRQRPSQLLFSSPPEDRKLP